METVVRRTPRQSRAHTFNRHDNQAAHLALAFVGEGPYRAELARLLPDAVLTGVLSGLDLARATADLAHNAALRAPMRLAARHAVETRDWAEAGRAFWGKE